MTKKKQLSEFTDEFGVPLMEMARLGNYEGYSFWVYTEPLKNPSFHVKYKNDFEIVIQAKDLTVLEIKFNNSRFEFKKKQQPPKSILKVIEDFLGDKNSKLKSVTNMDAFILLWDSLNG